MRDSLLARAAITLAVLCLLLIPLRMIEGLVAEREGRRRAAVDEIGATWGSPQTLVGQYLFVGFALALFYLLLLSLSEHAGFGPAYLAAACATTLLVAGYGVWALAAHTRALLLGAGLTALYGYLYVLLRLEDWALVLGATALFAILAGVMFGTRRVDWWSLLSTSAPPRGFPPPPAPPPARA